MTFLRSGMLALLLFSAAALAAEVPANGIFLVASRDLRDPNFRETVVLVTQPPQGGPFGLIINRPLPHRLSELFPEYEALRERDSVIHFGGPVERDGIVFLVRAKTPPPSATRVLDDVYVLTDLSAALDLLENPDPENTRVFAGYSGWAPGQLQSELRRGGWHVLPADAATVFDKKAGEIWPALIGRANLRRTRSLPVK
jgi:putative transcriptional regulator